MSDAKLKSLPVDPALLESNKRVAEMARTAWMVGTGSALLAGCIAFGAFLLIQKPGEVSGRITALEARLGEEVADLNARLGTVGERITTLEERPELPNGIREELAAVRALAEREPEAVPGITAEIRDLTKRLEETAIEPERLAALVQNLDELERQMLLDLDMQRAESGAIRDRLDAIEASVHQTPERLAAVLWIARAAERSEPFPNQMRAFRAVSSEPIAAILEAAARDGVPSRHELIGALPSIARAAARASSRRAAGVAEVSDEDGALASVTGWFRALVTVERVDGVESDNPLAELLRSDRHVGPGGLRGAMHKIRELPEEVQTEFAGWINDAERRIELDTEMDRLLDLAFTGSG